MIRKVQLNINQANGGKLQKLATVMDESLSILNRFIRILWTQKRFYGKFNDLKDSDTWLSARMQQCLGKQALETVKSQRKRHKKTMPVITRQTLSLDERFLSFQFDDNTFDIWIKIQSLGDGIILKVPARKHKHFNRFVNDGWTMKKSGRLRKTDHGWFLDVFFEKETPEPKNEGVAIGIDCGYKKLIACSDGRKADAGMEQCYEKISLKKQGSKAFDRALKERDNLINRSVNSMDFSSVKTIVVEALHNVKHKSKGKIRKQFNNKLQRWSYRKVFDKLSGVCEEKGIDFISVDPAYTSQTCSTCGHVDRKSRRNIDFLCTRCGISMDADYNASRNILMRGACSPPSIQLVL